MSLPNDEFTSSKKKCPYCGHENEPDYQFCGQCGNSLKKILCPNCNYENPIQVNFCGQCGVDLRTTTNQPAYQNITYSNTNPYSNSNLNSNIYPPPYQQPISYPSFKYKIQKPRWWKLPAFYLVYCVFGILMISVFIAVLILSVFMDLQSLPEVEYLNYINMASELVQLALIVLAFKLFKGLRLFFKPLTTETSQEDFPGQIVKYQLKNFKSIVRMILFILLFVSILLLIDLVGGIIINYLRTVFNTGPSTSSYSIIDNSVTQHLFLISFIAIVFAPIFEEILFRGFLQQALNRSETSDFAHYIIQGTLFSFAHLAGDIGNNGSIDFIIGHMLFTFSFAISATFLRKKFNSIIPSILLHGSMNAIGIYSTFLTTPYFTEQQLNILNWLFILGPIFLIIMILLIIYVFDGWRVNVPLGFKQEKNIKFISLILIVALVVNAVQYGFLLFPSNVGIIYLLLLLIISPLIFILWGVKIYDLPWKEVTKKPIKEETLEISKINQE